MTTFRTPGGVEYEVPDQMGQFRPEVEMPARVDVEQTARLLIRMERILELAEQERDISDHIAQQHANTATENFRRVKAAEAKIDELALTIERELHRQEAGEP